MNLNQQRLAGSERTFTSGIVWDVSELDMSTCWCWPSGYYAKSEFNIDVHTGKLINGREEQLVSFQQLQAQNLEFLKPTFEWKGRTLDNTTGTFVAPYNEVHFQPSLAKPIAIFARTLRYEDLLFTIGIAQFVENELGIALPLIVLEPQHGARWSRKINKIASLICGNVSHPN